MTGMKLDAGYTLHDSGHSRQGPQIGTESVMPGAFTKGPLDFANLRLGQTRFAASPSGPLQGLDATLFPFSIPTPHTLSAGLHLPGHRGQDRFTPSKEASSEPPSSRKFIEIAARSADHHEPIIRRV